MEAVVGMQATVPVPSVAGRPGRAAKVSQIDAPRPSSDVAPSIWYAAVATPWREEGPAGGGGSWAPP